MVARQIGSFGFTTCATPALLDAHGTPTSPDELRKLPTIGMIPSTAGYPPSFPFLQRAQIQPEQRATTNAREHNGSNAWMMHASILRFCM
jgi:hypothetical protein